jgi:hypothetical protein
MAGEASDLWAQLAMWEEEAQSKRNRDTGRILHRARMGIRATLYMSSMAALEQP